MLELMKEHDYSDVGSTVRPHLARHRHRETEKQNTRVKE